MPSSGPAPSRTSAARLSKRIRRDPRTFWWVERLSSNRGRRGEPLTPPTAGEHEVGNGRRAHEFQPRTDERVGARRPRRLPAVGAASPTLTPGPQAIPADARCHRTPGLAPLIQAHTEG